MILKKKSGKKQKLALIRKTIARVGQNLGKTWVEFGVRPNATEMRPKCDQN